MRFLYALVAVVLLSSSASAQFIEEQLGLDSLQLSVTGSPDITVDIYNYTPELPPAYFPADTAVTFYLTTSLFFRVEANGDTTSAGRSLRGLNVSGPGVVALNTAGTDGLSEACTAADVTNAAAIAGKVVLLARGTCNFFVKFQVAEALGAIGVVLYNPSYRVPPASDPNIVDGYLGGGPTAGQPNITVPGVFVPVGIAQPIIDEILAGLPVTLAIGNRFGTAAEPGVATTNSSLELRGANPFVGQTAFRVTTENTEEVRVELYNVRGQRVATLFEGVVAGERMVTLSSENLAAGVYFVRATGESFRFQEQVTVIR